MEASTQRMVAEESHHLVEEALLTPKPVHRRVRELLVDRVQIEEDGRTTRNDVRKRILQVVPGRILQRDVQLLSGVMSVENVPQLAVDRTWPPHPIEKFSEFLEQV